MYKAIHKDKDHPDVASTLNNIGHVYWYQKDYKQAESYYQRAYEMRKNCLVENHRDTQTSLTWRNNARQALARQQSTPQEHEQFSSQSDKKKKCVVQ